MNVEDKTSISMSFPIIDGEGAPQARPTDEEVLEACKGVIADGLLEHWGLGKGSAELCQWSDVQWQDTSGWKVQWDVLDKPSSSGSGAVPTPE